MHAVFQSGGKQYRVKPGDAVRVESLPAEVGASVSFDRVLMVGDGDGARVGTPFVQGARVSATVLAHGRGGKVTIFKLRRRKHSQKSQGHRQGFTQLRIEDVIGA